MEKQTQSKTVMRRPPQKPSETTTTKPSETTTTKPSETTTKQDETDAKRTRSNGNRVKRVGNHHKPRRSNRTTAKTTTNPPAVVRTGSGAESSASHRTTSICGYILEEQFGLRGEARLQICFV
ncbi:hypothetical protein QL285_068850 [Trifolium repens]|nr:hypothetical protein QL285_068850 [Trifolium repens]